ncbi:MULTISPECIES: FtsX-like permease family protein [Cellulomonas]|uniref:FtsX-like permease family protein n=1 Tax=Cellulomonas TaxID=1707 RepID=UPI000B3C5774|nr:MULTISPECIES: FtsX-like permease family protein [Cellulomonas]MBO9556718.1 FtsX-like permease family protein [Cellulomonas sp.]
MTSTRRLLLAVHREAMASARSQRTATSLVALIVAGMCVAVLLTSGRTAAAEDAVLSHIDDRTTRTIVLRATGEGSGLDTSVLAPLGRLEATEAVVGLGPSQDVTNVAIPGGTRVAARALYTAAPVAGLPVTRSPLPGSAAVSLAASYELGLAGRFHGALLEPSGSTLAVTSQVRTPDYLAFLEPLVVVPERVTDVTPLATVVVVTRSSSDVETVAGVARDLAAPLDPEHLTIETADELGRIRAAISGDLGTFGRSTVLGILAVTAALVAVNLYGLVLLRRRDFGRRRALGATRGVVVALLLWQVGVVAAWAATAGTAAAVAVLRTEAAAPLPDARFVVAVAVLAVGAAVAAAVPPALYAASRDPLRELRVP